MIKEVKEWLHDIFISKYVVTRIQTVRWGIYIGGKLVKETNGFTPIEMLVKQRKKKSKLLFTRNIMTASKFNKLKAIFILWKLKKRATNNEFFEIKKTGEVVFITEITGLTKN